MNLEMMAAWEKEDKTIKLEFDRVVQAKCPGYDLKIDVKKDTFPSAKWVGYYFTPAIMAIGDVCEKGAAYKEHVTSKLKTFEYKYGPEPSWTLEGSTLVYTTDLGTAGGKTKTDLVIRNELRDYIMKNLQ